MTVDIETIFTLVFVLVDDWYKEHGARLLKGKRGAKPVFGRIQNLGGTSSAAMPMIEITASMAGRGIGDVGWMTRILHLPEHAAKPAKEVLQ